MSCSATAVGQVCDGCARKPKRRRSLMFGSVISCSSMSSWAIEDAMFAALGVDGFAGLDDPELAPLLVARCGKACHDNDAKFFIRLGRVLSERESFEPSKLDAILVTGWCGEPDLPGLCF